MGGVQSYRKEFFSARRKSISLRIDTFLKGLHCQGKKTWNHKFFLLFKNGGGTIQLKIKGDNFPDFLFANLQDEVFPKWGLLIQEEFALIGANSFLKELTLNEKGGK